MTGAMHHGEILTRAVERLSTASELSTVTETVAAAARALVGSDGATFVLREDERCFYVDEDAIGPLWKGQKFPLKACISGWSMLHREVVVLCDIYLDARIPHDAYRPTFVKSLCMVPIREQSPIGALGCYWSREHAASPEEVRLLQVLANSASVALENLELRGAVTRRSLERDTLATRKQELESAIHSLVHDLRNPLGVMMGFAQILEDSPGDAAVHELCARSISTSGEQLLRQIDRMLALYRITNRPIQPEPLDLSAIARELADGLRAQNRARSVDFSIQADLRAVADPVLTRLMLDNLLSNAVKYTSKKPAAVIELGRMDRGAPLSTFFVKDNGDGFWPNDAHRLFRPMTRLHTDAEFPGTGLGLASVARIVELHGGQIHAEGKKHEGATFYFTLPNAA
ncbi:MAG TPA: GAF domain-containing sensor histidine kinase [Polyangiales bacterium]